MNWITSEAKWIQVYLGNCINENCLSLWKWHLFHPYDLVLISELSERSMLYHFNVLKCNFCFIINIWQKCKSSISVFKPSHCSQEGPFTVFSPTSKQTVIINLWKRWFFNCYLTAQWPTLGHLLTANIFFFVFLLNVVFISFIF